MDNSEDFGEDLPPGMAELDMELEKLTSNSLDIHSMSNRSGNSSFSFNGRQDVTLKSMEHDRKRSNKSSRKPPQKPGEKIVKTRAPPKKPYEPAPFLSIDNIPLDKKTEEKEPTNNGQSKLSPKVPVNTPAGFYSFSTQSKNGSGITQSLSSSDWNRMVPKKHKAVSKKAQQISVNGHVRSPFKHERNKPTEKKHVVLPDQKMKEDTAAATYQVAKIIAKQDPETERKIPGRLLKARLKPLNTVNVTGPTMHHCRGIVSETRSYTPSPNRTLQRRRYILNNLNRDFLYERPQTAESIHHTSVASDITESREHDIKQELDYLDMQEEVIAENDNQDQGHSQIPPNSFASFSALDRANESAPQNGADHVTNPVQDQNKAEEVSNEPADKGTTEDDPDRQVVDQQADYLRNIKDTEGSNRGSPQRSDDVSGDLTVPSSNGIQRPRSVQYGGSRKSVRFVEGQESGATKVRARSAMPRLHSTHSNHGNEREDAESRKEKKNSRVSCRPDDSDPVNGKDDDNDEDQEAPESSTNPQGGSSSESSNRGQSSGNTNMTCDGQKQSGEPNDKAEPQHGVRTSISGIMFGSEDDTDSANPRPPSRGTRPRSRLGFWEGISKPDDDVEHLVVSGQGKDFCARDEEETELTSHHNVSNTGVPFVKNRRPQSAKGPRPQQVKRQPQKPRPQSARNLTLDPDVSMSMNTATLNERPQSSRGIVSEPPRQNVTPTNMRRPQSATSRKVKTNSNNQSQPRPQSAKSELPNRAPPKHISVLSKKTGRPLSAKTKQRPASAKSKKYMRVQFGATTVVSGGDGQDCSYCGRKTQKNINFESGNYFAFCESCRQQSDPQRRVEQKDGSDMTRIETPNEQQLVEEVLEYQRDQSDLIEQLEGLEVFNGNIPQLTNFEVSDCEEETLQNVEEEEDHKEIAKLIEWVNAECVQNISDKDNAPESNVFEPAGQGNNLEPSSNVSQHEFHREGERNEKSIKEDSLLLSLDVIEKSLDEVQNEIKECLIKARAEVSVADADAEFASATGRVGSSDADAGFGGELSTKLIGDVGHQWKAIEHTMKVYQFVEPDSKTKETSGPGENVSQTTHTQEVEGGQTTVAKGDISTYDVTLMSPLQHIGQQQLMEQQREDSKVNENNTSTECSTNDDPLEVRATALHKPRSDPVASGASEKTPVAPYAPLCFQVNARPPQGYLYYFAYGMDMNPDRLGTYVHRDVAERFWGLLFGFRLMFNKKGMDEEAGAFPNMELHGESSIEGCLYLITPNELSLMDKTMGYPEHYEHVVLPVWLLNCPDAEELGVAQYCVAAVMYVARDKWIHKGPTPLDCEYSVGQSLKGSSILSPEYVAQLRSHAD